MLHFAGADAERQRAERAVRGGVAVAADHGHAGLREAELRSDHVDDALTLAVNPVVRDAELLAVGLELLHLLRGDLVDDGERAVGGRNAVIGGREREVRTADLQAALAQAFERLRRRDFMDEVQVDIERAGAPGCSGTTWESQSFSMMVRGLRIRMNCRQLRKSAAHTASPTCSVVAGVAGGPQVRGHVGRDSAPLPSRVHGGGFFFSPKLYSSIAATEPIAPSGLALFWPAMSGAEP